MADFKLKGHLAMAGANIMWGVMAPMVKICLASGLVTTVMLTSFRMYGGALLFWFASIFFPKEHVAPKDFLWLFGAAMFGIVLNQGSYIFGVSHTAPGEAAIVTTTMPIWVMLLAWVILKEPVTLKKAGGIALGGCGAVLLVLGSATSVSVSGDNPTLGDIFVLSAQFSYALYLTLFRNFIKKYSIITLMKWMFTFAALVIMPFSLGDIVRADWGGMGLPELGGAFYVVFCGTFLAYILTMVGQKNLRPTLVGMYNYVQPIVAMVLSIVLGLDAFTPTKALAVCLIFTGVYLVTISRSLPSDQKQ